MPPPPPPPKNRSHVPAKGGQSRQPPRQPGRRMASRDAGERAAFFARREAATVLRRVLRGDASKRSGGSIKSLVFSPSVRNKRATFALVCQTLKYLPILKEVLVSSGLFTSKWKKQEELVYVTAYDILFGQEIVVSGSVEEYIMLHKDTFKIALQKICVKRKVSNVEDLLSEKTTVKPKPRFVRVNTLKTTTGSVIEVLSKMHKVIDACAAPGNKTVHLAALMNGEGSIIACELNKERAKTLQHTVRKSGANNIETVIGDFLNIDSNDPSYAEVRAILLDPSCSGSGISTERLDHLLPSHSIDDQGDAGSSARIRKLSAFQRKALSHALSFPSVERLVYSTCSIHQAENEDVVSSVLPLASSLGFELSTPFPQWRRRGLPVFDGAEHLLRTDPEDDLEGFFIALFVRKAAAADALEPSNTGGALPRKRKRACTTRSGGLRAFSSLRLSRMDVLCSIWGL
ncbi:25S rRNA (cytosine-C(5))-methyltransferase NSUN5 isoform X2 [Hordeum vulgare subsp. vulgare]|uniref:SAM-dependent MTase RsmB/NOP-type domain-containing protein n=1 Tax=Hordeum vulgare subsp. vulgare TaxID=112509 RepID=A0A8I6YAK9_HORVV|nr:25S rRNA (cytosine-C(5))-methyltransferase NSUN5 isoform X2 [Hordeum vulgare subsp. vulgare]